MRTTTKYMAIGGAMLAALGAVGVAQAGDRNNDRDGQQREWRHHGDKDGMGWRRDRDGRGHHGPRHYRGGHGMGGHHGGPGMMGGGMMGMMGGHGGPMGRMAMMRIFQLADTDGDKSVTQEDFDAFITSRMEQYDANGDGSLQLDEYKAFFAEMVEPMAVRSFQHLDPDGNAALTAEEFGEPVEGVVERMDRDGDGKLTLQDRRGRHHGGWRDRDDRRPGERSGMMDDQAGDEPDEDGDETPVAE